VTPQEARAEMDRINALPDTEENAIAKWITYWKVAEIWIAGFGTQEQAA
jgi:hypothetical protein